MALNHPSLRAAQYHAHCKERRPDGKLDCTPCRERTRHGTLDGYTNWRCRCDDCREGMRAHAEPRNKYQYRLEYQREWQNKLARWKIEQKIGKSCRDCGLSCSWENYIVFDWDHRPDETKLFDISSGSKARATILAEMAKCDLVCANCHRLRTFHRGWVNQHVSGEHASQ